MSIAITALIPSFNGQKLLERNLPAVLTCLRDGDELIIIDDASTDNSVAWLSKRFSCSSHVSPLPDTDVLAGQWTQGKKTVTIQVLVNRTNQRFGMSANRGVQLAQHPYIFLLNSDVAPHPDAVAPLLKHFTDPDQGETVFGVGCLELSSSAQGEKKTLAGKQKLWFQRGLFMHSKADEFTFGPTGWVTGGSGMFSKEKWLTLGGFDQRYYPAYWEDIDLSFQARRRGWQVLFEANSKVDHNHETTNQTVFGQQQIVAMSWKNALQFTWKNSNLWQKLAFLAWQPYWWTKLNGKTWWSQWWLAVCIILLSTLLRSWQLGQVPHGLTWDEAAIGYNGFAIITTRRDEWLHRLPVSFRSFGDYKAPLAIYLNGIFTTVLGLGLEPWAIRLPFMLSGVIGVLGVLLLTYEGLEWVGLQNTRYRQWLSLAAAAWLAISPWHLHFTRAGFESGLSTTLVIWAAWFWLRAIKSGVWTWWLLSALSWVASVYAYHSAKIVAPGLLVALTLTSWRTIWLQRKGAFFAAFLAGLTLVPLLLDMIFGAGLTRASSLIFSRVHSMPEFFSMLTTNLVDHSSLQFWAMGDTTTLRHSDGHFGIVYWWDLLALGLTVFGFGYRRWQKQSLNWWDKWVLAGGVWSFIGLLPAILGDEVPHPNRALLAVSGVGWLAIAGWHYGLSLLQLNAKKTRQWIGIILAGYLICLALYQYSYYVLFPKQNSEAFNDGYLEAAQFAVAHEKDPQQHPPIEKILFSNHYGQPYIYVLLARRTNPIWYQGGALIKYEFTDKITVGDLDRPNTLIVASEVDTIPTEKADSLIKGGDGQIRFKLYLPRTQP